MIPLLFILYYFSKTFITCYFLINYLIAVVIYFKASKNYFPRMKYTQEEKKKFDEQNQDASKHKKQYFHEDYPSFSRIEFNSISFAKIYFGTLNYFWLKAFLGVLFLFLIWLRLKVYFIGRSIERDFSKEDRANLMKIANGLVSLLYKSQGVWVTETNLEEDLKVKEVYRKYLGPNYDPKEYKEKYTTVIANHVSWADVLYMSAKVSSSFIAKDSVKQVPLAGYISGAFKTLYINRSSTDSKKEILNDILKRQLDYAKGTAFMPLCLYPEGTTSNGRSIISFKKGAFYSLTPIKMFLMKVDNKIGSFPLAAGGMNILIHLILSLTYLKNDFEAIELPVFAPNEYLYENFQHFGKDKPEIFSEACRRVMSEIGALPLSNSSFDTKLNYMSEVNRKKIKNT